MNSRDFGVARATFAEVASAVQGMNPHESAFAESFISKARWEPALELLTAIEQIVGPGTGTVLSCVLGKLAYFEGKIRETVSARSDVNGI